LVALRPFEALTIEWPMMVTADVRAASRERRSSVSGGHLRQID
jgi:hypothetical protein